MVHAHYSFILESFDLLINLNGARFLLTHFRLSHFGRGNLRSVGSLL